MCMCAFITHMVCLMLCMVAYMLCLYVHACVYTPFSFACRDSVCVFCTCLHTCLYIMCLCTCVCCWLVSIFTENLSFPLQSTQSLLLVAPDEGRVLSATFSSEKSVLLERIQRKVKVGVV